MKRTQSFQFYTILYNLPLVMHGNLNSKVKIERITYPEKTRNLSLFINQFHKYFRNLVNTLLPYFLSC